jgi:plasmid maintenance system antidote protein VapI
MDHNEDFDDRGSDQFDALRILRNLRDRAFDSSNEKLAVALGRPVHEVETLTHGAAAIDDDMLMKARGIAKERGVDIEA